jgi:energy-coupling factor transporter ATP-binding protein EcfA2
MRLQKIELENFRSYGHLDLAFTEPRTLIIGENGVGKSTIADAIALVLTGRCRGVNGKGEGQKDLIRGGADEARITLHLDGLPPITRTIHRSHGANSTVPTEAILAKLGATDAYVTAAVYGHTFFDLGHADAKALLMRLLDVQIELPEEGGAVTLNLDDADLKYKAAFDQRASLKRTLAAMPVRPLPPAPAWLPDAKDRREDHDTRTQLDVADARTKYEAAVEMTAELRAKAGQVLQALEAARREPAQGLDALKALHEQATEDLRQAEAELAEADNAMQAARALPAEATATLQAEVNELRVFVRRIEDGAPTAKKPGRPKKGDQGPTCVLGQGIPCMTPAAEFQAVKKATEQRIADLEAKVKAGTERAQAIGAATTRANQASIAVDRQERRIADLDVKIVNEQRRLADLERLTREWLDLEPDAKQAQAAVNQRTDELNAAIERQRELADYQKTLDLIEQDQQRRQDVQDDLTKAERLVDLLGPKGLRMKALNDALDDFHEAINAALEPFGFTLAISVDPWQVLVSHANTGGRQLPFALLSKGQKLWTGLAFQLALAAVSGLDFCIVDDAEGVVGEARARLTDVALDAPVGQILIVKAQAEHEAAPDVDGLQVVRIGHQEAAAASAF